MNHQGLRWNVHCVANVALRIPLNLYKRGFKIYDLLVKQYSRSILDLSGLNGHPMANKFLNLRRTKNRQMFED